MLINQKALLFPKRDMPGSMQMAMDLMMLEKTRMQSNISFALRFYTWEGCWLSIGKNQKILPRHWLELVKERKLKIVRRPSGGKAVLHSGGLTYSLVWLSPPRKKHEAYYQASQWLIKGFSSLGLNLKFGVQSSSQEEGNCFATSTLSDLVDPEGIKRIGSAQFWDKGNLLQHGEIVLNPPKKLWLDLFKTKAPKPATNSIPRKNLDQKLYQACLNFWPQFEWEHADFTKKEFDQISKNSEKFLIASY